MDKKKLREELRALHSQCLSAKEEEGMIERIVLLNRKKKKVRFDNVKF